MSSCRSRAVDAVTENDTAYQWLRLFIEQPDPQSYRTLIVDGIQPFDNCEDFQGAQSSGSFRPSCTPVKLARPRPYTAIGIFLQRLVYAARRGCAATALFLYP